MSYTIPYEGTIGTSNIFYVSLVSKDLVLIEQQFTEPGIYQVLIDLSAMTASHRIAISIHETTTAGEAMPSTISEDIVVGTQPTIWTRPALVLMNGWDIRVHRQAGNPMSISWSIRKVG